jgi:hypothetical protein
VAGSAGTATAGGSGGVTPGSSIGYSAAGGCWRWFRFLMAIRLDNGIPLEVRKILAIMAGGWWLSGFYQVGSSLINSGSGIGGTVGGRSS